GPRRGADRQAHPGDDGHGRRDRPRRPDVRARPHVLTHPRWRSLTTRARVGAVGRVRRVVGGHEVATTLLDLARRGDREPPVVVLVHGVGVSSRYLVRLARALSGDAVVVAPDLVGFGASPRADEPLTIGEHADVLGGLL